MKLGIASKKPSLRKLASRASLRGLAKVVGDGPEGHSPKPRIVLTGIRADEGETFSEDSVRVLTTTDPKASKDLVEFSYTEGAFVPIPPPSPTIRLIHIEGKLLHKESEDGKKQLLLIKPVRKLIRTKTFLDMAAAESAEPDDDESKAPEDENLEEDDELDQEDGSQTENDGDKYKDPDEDDSQEPEITAIPKESQPLPTGKKAMNQFNFCERGFLTASYPMRDAWSQTRPPPRSNFSRQVTQWEIFDAYSYDYEHVQKEKEKEKPEKKVVSTAAAAAAIAKAESQRRELPPPTMPERQAEKTRVLERMVNQNIFNDITHDYKYWEDPSDAYRDEDGTLLPLWKFQPQREQLRPGSASVTALCWNRRYPDLFAVVYGSLNLMRPVETGVVALFTLKNPSQPEFFSRVPAPGGCCSVDIHRDATHFLAIGLGDGNVAVYNAQNSEQQYFSQNHVKNKHQGPVTEVCWGEELPDGELNFFSISMDGSVFHWMLTSHSLVQTTIITLWLDPNGMAETAPDSSQIRLKACCTALAFHPTLSDTFLVGTEEGFIFKCNTQYSIGYIQTFQAHHMPVYKIDYNKFNADIFVSCSPDWRVKIWEDNLMEPLFEFELGHAVTGVEWAPYSSTVFAACTTDGKVHVFDIDVNKYQPICKQQVIIPRRGVLTSLAFNWRDPIILVSDNKGSVTSLKLSPNLRIKVKPPKKGVAYDHNQLEKTKLEKLLALVRDPKGNVIQEETKEEGNEE